MKYELWIESSPSFLDFKNSLAKRGFTNTPITDKTFLGVPVSIKSNGVMKLPRQNIMMKRGGNN